MDEVNLHYDVSAYDFTRAGEASGKLKRSLKTLGFSPAVIRNVAIAVYEAEMNIDTEIGVGTTITLKVYNK